MVDAALQLPTAAEVAAARVNIAGHAIRTPLLKLNAAVAGVNIFVKLENLQPLGSFKIRPAVNALKSMHPERLRHGVLTASAGNFGQGLALAAREMAVPATVVVPDSAAANKTAALHELGATVIRVPFNDWWTVLTTRSFPGVGGVFVHPVAESAVVAGNATIAAEIIEELPNFDAVVVPFRRRRPHLGHRLSDAALQACGADDRRGIGSVAARGRGARQRRPGPGATYPELRRRHGQHKRAGSDVATGARNGGRGRVRILRADLRCDTASRRAPPCDRRGGGSCVRRSGGGGPRGRGQHRLHRIRRQHRRGKAWRNLERAKPVLGRITTAISVRSAGSCTGAPLVGAKSRLQTRAPILVGIGGRHAAAPQLAASPAMARKKLAKSAAGRALQGADQSLFDDFLPHLIARLAYQLNSDLIEKLRHEGINVTRWRILAVLAMGDGVTISKIIDRAMMQQSALSRALMNMESEGYVRRGPRRDDARYVEVFLTDKGRALFGALNVVVRRRQSRLLRDLSRDEVAAAFALIRRLSRNMAG